MKQPPLDVAVSHTLRYLAEALPAHCTRVLDVGCGSGRLAEALRADRYQVVAIDRRAEAVAEARRRGVEARTVDFLDESELEERHHTFDVVLFSRSLHHLVPLDGAIRRAASMLVPAGLMVCEEFDHERIDEATAGWYYRKRQDLLGDQPVTGSLLARWQRDHHHDPPLHSAGSMIAAMTKIFTIERLDRTAYLYRYLCERLDGPDAPSIAESVFEEECGLIEQGSLLPVGLRIVGRCSLADPQPLSA